MLQSNVSEDRISSILKVVKQQGGLPWRLKHYAHSKRNFKEIYIKTVYVFHVCSQIHCNVRYVRNNSNSELSYMNFVVG